MDENKNKKPYIIVGLCCVAALVTGLFAGKAIADNRKLAAAEKYISEYGDRLEDSSADASAEESALIEEASADTSEAEETAVEIPQTEEKWVTDYEISYSFSIDSTYTNINVYKYDDEGNMNVEKIYSFFMTTTKSNHLNHLLNRLMN